ncbi:MAG: pantetheine-phosphate adenylyltransferase [Candidatus Micrarchaeota archaeon]|nr:pantetheine-phosphate adenylyltransferase [Candidatus Micrarchaeota archaeon]
MTKAIYAFSGDPITYGHIDIVERAAKVFDELIVGIGANPDKKYMFTLEERADMAKSALSHIKNVKVVSFSGLLVDFAYENDISIIIKGIRDAKDFDYEFLLQQVGESQKLGIDTFFVLARPDKAHISSSAVKALQKEQGLIHEFVPLYVKQCLEAKMSGQYIVGVTGEIGAGKSYVSQELEELGKKHGIKVHNIELDRIGHQILEELKDPMYVRVREELAKEFGKSIMLSDGMIDRKALGEIVFSDKRKLEKLNVIMEKPLLVRIRKEVHGRRGLILLNAALLAESEMLYLCNNNVILVTSDEESQKRRLLERGLSDIQIERRIKSQYSNGEKKRKIELQIKRDNQGHLWVIDDSDNADEKKIEMMFDDIIKRLGIT